VRASPLAYVLAVRHVSSTRRRRPGASHPSRVDDLVRLFCGQLRKLATVGVTDVELARAKNMLKCNVLTHLESRLVLFEDLARQFATYDKRQSLAEMTAAIDAVQIDDVLRVGKHLNSQPPALAAHGPDLSKLPDTATLHRLFGGASPSLYRLELRRGSTSDDWVE